MGSKNDLSNRINESYSKLSKGQKLLATYITDNYDKAVFLTAAKLGEANPRLCALPCILDTGDILNFRVP